MVDIKKHKYIINKIHSDKYFVLKLGRQSRSLCCVLTVIFTSNKGKEIDKKGTYGEKERATANNKSSKRRNPQNRA